MVIWHKTKEYQPTKSGMYLIITRSNPLPGDECGLYVDCCRWMRKGDYYTPDPIPQDGRPKHKRLIGILTGEYDKKVEADGFYEQDGDVLYPINVEFWTELPVTPEGRAANAPEV